MSFNVGDKVTVWLDSEPQEVRKIVRVAGRKVVDDKGGEWLARNGCAWGSTDRLWGVQRIRATNESDVERVEVLSLQRTCGRGLRSAEGLVKSCNSLSDLRAIQDSLRTILSIIGEVHQ